MKKKFLDRESALFVNLDSDILSQILSRIEAQDFSPDLFNSAEKDVGHALRFGVFSDWQREHPVAPSSSIDIPLGESSEDPLGRKSQPSS